MQASDVTVQDFNGGGGSFKVNDGAVGLVDGDGNWDLTGVGQDFEIRNRKDGKGSLTLHGFKNVTIKEKNGRGALIVTDCASCKFKKVDGDGHVYLRFNGPKEIEDKNGKGNIYYTGSVPVIHSQDSTGKIIPEA